jgi:hypothetical protein
MDRAQHNASDLQEIRLKPPREFGEIVQQIWRAYLTEGLSSAFRSPSAN